MTNIVHSQVSARHTMLSYVQTHKPNTYLTAVDQHFHFTQHTSLTEMHSTSTKTLKYFTQTPQASSIPAADRASRDSRQHTDSRDFILAARGLPLIFPGYIYCSGWRSEGIVSGGGTQQLRPYQPLRVWAAAWTDQEKLADHVVVL